MEHESFPPEVAKRLGWYVYRLIDPRNGETFYVGKGKGDRVFQHVAGALRAIGNPDAEDAEDANDLKLQQIKEIAAAGLTVGHIIHRHNIESEKVAFQIEGALIDAYPGLTNRVGGHGSGDYGVRHAREVIREYAAQPFEAWERLILISIAQTFKDPSRSVYDAVRGCWVLNPTRARDYKLVLAHNRGIVIEAFRPAEWVPATVSNFPWLAEDETPRRWGFNGSVAEENVRRLYVQKRVPDQYRAQGAASPIRYVESATTSADGA